ncbi:hypothetical protein, partial [Bradyrhizobium vignae]
LTEPSRFTDQRFDDSIWSPMESAGMVKPLSMDLREGVLACIETGLQAGRLSSDLASVRQA